MGDRWAAASGPGVGSGTRAWHGMQFIYGDAVSVEREVIAALWEF